MHVPTVHSLRGQYVCALNSTCNATIKQEYGNSNNIVCFVSA